MRLLRAPDAPGGAALSIQNVQHELASLWQDTYSRQVAGTPITRAVLLTLAAICPAKSRAGEVSQLIGEVVGDHPSRAIVACTQGSASGGSISATVHISCQLLKRANRQICGEQILMETGGADVGQAVGAILALALPDVPLVVWLAGDLPEAAGQLERLLEQADRVLVDSRWGGGAFEWIAGRLNATETPVVDLGWVASEGRRLALARIFDHQHHRLLLPDIRRVTVAYSSDSRNQALLLAGWVLSRLRWQTPSRSGADEWVSQEGRQLVLSHEVDGEDVVRIALEAGARAKFRADFRTDQGEALLCSPAHEDAPEEQVVPLELRSKAQVLCGALELTASDEAYAGAVSVAAELAGL